ncbi:MAG: BamA/TamA family outer membrane protein [Prevotella sp.]|nr:BamA/TamA family outer membrane protein [Prevotella sp.]
MAACSSTKFVSDKQYLLESVEVKADEKNIDASTLAPYIRQHANSKWFSIFKIPLGTYALSGRDTTKWINRTLQKIGEEPVIFDSVQAKLSIDDLRKALQNMGYMNAAVDLQTKVKGKKLKAIYTLHPGVPFFIKKMRYDIQDENIRTVLENYRQTQRKRNPLREEGLQVGDKFTVGRLDQERIRITEILMDSGYYRFHKDFIQYTADSAANSTGVDLTLHLMKYRQDNSHPETLHPRYTIRNITYQGGDETNIPLRRRVLENSTAIQAGRPFSATDLQKTYNNFGKMRAVRYTDIRFREIPDSSQLDCNINVSMNKPYSISFQPEGTNTAGNLGAAASLNYENRNIFHGAEVFSVGLRGAYEAITGLEGYRDENYKEYGVEAKLQFPRFIAPFLSNNFRRRSNATSELSLMWDLQDRPEFHRRVFSTAWRYRWADPNHHLTYRYDLLDLNYIYMPWISETFKHDYLDSVSNRNAILRYNYEDLFIMKMGFGISYTDGTDAVRANIETAGNVLNAVSKITGSKENENGQYTFFNIAYAQYVKFDFDYTHIFRLDSHNNLALHGDFGIAWPYGNSNILPFEKRYFAGGANNVRGWSVRSLGPGTYRGSDGRIDFINQTGDMKLYLSAEYRTYLFWKFNGAAFIDAGNIWTLRNYADQPGGQFKFNEFYKQIAVGYGIGLRLNFDYFILRFDMGMKAINPAYETQDEHWALFHPDFGRDFAFHFAVGLPF